VDDASGKSSTKARLDPYAFKSLKEFIEAVVQHLSAQKNGYSLRQLSKDAGLSIGLLPLVLSGKRRLTSTTLEKIMKCLPLAAHEKIYLRSLRMFRDDTSSAQKSRGLSKLQRSAKFRKQSNAEFATFRYLSHWFMPAIREMVGLSDFVPTPEFIQSRLWRKVSIAEIRRAWKFLVDHQFVIQNSSGRWSFEGIGMIRCEDQVLRLAMIAFYKQMYEVSVESFDAIPREERDHQGLLIALDKESKAKAQALILETIEKIEALAKASVNRDEVCFLGTMMVPLTKKPANEKD
jgi:uncharacterized protein (TIGR02147 family)